MLALDGGMLARAKLSPKSFFRFCRLRNISIRNKNDNRKAQTKKANATISMMKTDKISHTSIIGSENSLDNIIFTSIINGIDDRDTNPAANNFRIFKRLKIPNIIHMYTIEISDIIVPIEKTAFTFIKSLNMYKYGITKILIDIKPPRIPFLPNTIIGNDTTQANIIELIGIKDHVKLPDIAISQMAHTINPIKSVVEKMIETITFLLILFSSFFFSAIKFSAAEILKITKTQQHPCELKNAVL